MKANTLPSHWYNALHKCLSRSTAGCTVLNIHERVSGSGGTIPLSYSAIHAYLLRSLRDMGLTAPFSWPTYVQAMRSAYAQTHPHVQIELESDYLPQGTFARWIAVAPPLVCADAGNNAERSSPHVLLTLLIVQSANESQIERAVYHEIAHLVLGHLALPTCPPETTLPTASDSVVMSDATLECEAELYATVLQRLAHGWDPGALPAPRLEGFFDVLG